MQERDTFLAEMTEDVAEQVLRNNYQQPLAISLAERRGVDDLGFMQRLMQVLEAKGELDRDVEFLPDDMELEERRKRSQSLTRPEIAVLLAYAKLSLKTELLDTNVPDDPYLGRELGRYFPQLMSERFSDALQKHRLRREIIATQLTNSMINRGGPALVARIADETGASAASIAAAFAAVRGSYDMPALNDAINTLDNKVAGDLQLSLYAAVQDLLLDRLVWFLRNVDLGKGLDDIVKHYRAGVEGVAEALEDALPKEAAAEWRQRCEELANAGIRAELALWLGSLPLLSAATDIALVAERTRQPIAQVTATYFAAESFFRLNRIVAAARTIQTTDYFDRLALDRARDSIGEAERRITAAMVATGAAGDAAVEAWVKPRVAEVDRIRAAVHEISGSGLTLSKLAVAASLLGDLAKN
jgi:glutamate dehydrogenase